MKKHLNDPSINRKYNYLYKLTNKINGKIYIGVHRTDNIDDGYMGSGVLLKRSQKKYGIENFEKIILQYFDTYQEALDRERELVTEEFINDDGNYNIREGGYGNCRWSSSARLMMSDTAKKNWENEEYRDMMNKMVYSNPLRNKKVSEGVIKWIEDNPEAHYDRMLKINHNPEKIRKMAEAHTGMKRSANAKTNISKGIIDSIKNDPEKHRRRSGTGSIYIHNPETNEVKRQSKDHHIPEGWIRGSGPAKNRCYDGLNLGSVFAYNPETKQNKRFKNKESVPNGWILGRFKAVK